MKVATSVEPIWQVWGWVLIFWSLYRYFFRLPEAIDELVVKPLVFLGPVVWFVLRVEKRSLLTLGFTLANFFRNLYMGLGFGFLFALEGLAVNWLKYGQLQINPIAAFEQYGILVLLGLSLATAVVEETLARGFLFTRLWERRKSLVYAVAISTLMFTLLHLPILVTSLKFQGTTLILFFVTKVMIGVANALLFYASGSLMAPVLVHIFWNMTVALYL